MAISKPQPYDHDHENEVTVFAATNFRSEPRKFGIKTDDRRRHMYVIGKTGMGKTTLLENMVLSDIYAGHGVTYVDPHGDTARKLLDYIPSHRINDVVYFNPADLEHPTGFNILESVDDDKKHLVAAGLMGVFKKIWPDVWSARMEYILLNTIMALLDYPGATLMGMNRLLSDKEFRKKVVSVIQDPVVKMFWVKEFASFTEKYATEAVAPVQNKIGQFLSAGIIRNIVSQTKSSIDFRDIMDNRKIFIVNLSKGAVGEENSRLLGAMIITRLQLAAMERVDIPNEEDRQDFYMYVDEFQNFATESFANILSEARKYRLNLIMAHQYIEQLDETVAAAIFGNVGTLISFRVGAADAEVIAKEFAPQFTEEDMVNLGKYDVYLKLMIDGASSQPFSASTLPPIAQKTGSMEKVIRVSRERYGRPRSVIEEKVLRWISGGESEENEGTTIDKTPEQLEIERRLEELSATSPKISGPPPKGEKKPIVAEMACSVCGKISKLSFQPDKSRPWYCKEHLDMRSKETQQGKVRTPRPERHGARPEKREPSRRPERPAMKDLKPIVKTQESVRDPVPKEVSLSALMKGASEEKKDERKRDVPLVHFRETGTQDRQNTEGGSPDGHTHPKRNKRKRSERRVFEGSKAIDRPSKPRIVKEFSGEEPKKGASKDPTEGGKSEKKGSNDGAEKKDPAGDSSGDALKPGQVITF